MAVCSQETCRSKQWSILWPKRDKTVLFSEMCLALVFKDSMFHYGLCSVANILQTYIYSSASHATYFFSCNVQYLIGFVFVRLER